MADLIISPIFDFIFANLTSLAIKEIKLLWNVEDEVNSLSDTLSTIRAVLEDAEEQQITSRAVKDWLRKLKDVAYDADDILDDFATQAAQAKIEKVQPESSSRSKQVNKFFTCCFRANELVIKHEMGSKINEIRERLDKIESDRRFHLNTSSQGRTVEKIVRPKTSSFVHVSDVIGRDDDKKQILQILMSDESNHGNNFSVLPIVGMGGQGKTTLAQLVYNDKQLQNLFEVRAWVCVSDNFDVLRITHEIIESVTKKHFESLAIEPTQHRLLELLSGKRFLIILDDVWNEDPFDWEILRHPFFGGARGSKIIVTTRIEKVAQIMGTIPPHLIKRLSEHDSWSLFVRKVFGDDNLDTVQGTLVEIGKKIVGKCGGLPLAIKSLGGMLSTKREESVWKNVLESKIWELRESDKGILPALRLSYNHLSSNLKQCFSYCSIFPKDYQFFKEELVKLWMGEGYIQSKAGMEMEEVGEELFDDLLARSFFSLLSNDDTTVYNMHDLIHDLAEFVSQDDCLRIDTCELIEAPKDVRHLGFVQSLKNTRGQIKLDELYACKNPQRIRTFIHTNLTWDDALVQLGDSFDKFSCLRVLSLSDIKMKEIPSSIGYFKHLRYLDLSHNLFERLPNSICSFYTLQTLKLKWCKNLIELPKGTMDLINLRHLQLDGCFELTCSPPKMGKLTQLRDLSNFIVGRDESGCTIVELKPLVNLGKKIEISSLENVANRDEAEEADLKSKKHLERLTLKWNDNREIFDNSGREEEVLEGLQPHINLKRLRISGYMGACLPSCWLLPSLRTLEVIGCRKLERLSLHLCPQLSELNIARCFELVEDLMSFPSLKKLILNKSNVSLLKSVPYLTSLESLEIWSDDEVEYLDIQNLLSLRYLTFVSCSKLSRFYPPANLRRLTIFDCDNLEALPLDLHNLSSLNSLKLVYCPKVASLPEKGLPASLTHLDVDSCPLLTERCEKETGEDWHKISHIPDICIDLERDYSQLSSSSSDHSQ